MKFIKTKTASLFSLRVFAFPRKEKISMLAGQCPSDFVTFLELVLERLLLCGTTNLKSGKKNNGATVYC